MSGENRETNTNEEGKFGKRQTNFGKKGNSIRSSRSCGGRVKVEGGREGGREKRRSKGAEPADLIIQVSTQNQRLTVL